MMDYNKKDFVVCTNRDVGFILPKVITKNIKWKAVTNEEQDPTLSPHKYKKKEPYIHLNSWLVSDKVMCCPPIVNDQGTSSDLTTSDENGNDLNKVSLHYRPKGSTNII